MELVPSLARLSWVAFAVFGLLMAPALPAASPEPPHPSPSRYALALHGGAGLDPATLTAAEQKERIASLGKALDAGTAVLASGGSSLDAVEKVVRLLEDDPQFNAGRGATFTSSGTHELDASIMDGRTKECGAVAGTRTVKNPISLARLVMTRTPHILLSGEGAEEFATAMEVERVEPGYFWTDAQRRRYEAFRAKQSSAGADAARGTVGCVALDSHGNLAAATSTGGLAGKRPGRIGDSPLIGAGNYADNATCAISGTGIGEQFIRHVACYDVAARMAYGGRTLEQAVREAVQKTLRPHDGGFIAVDRQGRIAMEFNTTGMARAAADGRGYREIALGR